jgi:hypothetical protein
MKLTREQRVALKRLYDRTGDTIAPFSPSYREFRREVQYMGDCIMVRWCGMWLGIERDGYTHS